MSVQLPADVIERLKAAPRIADVVGPDGRVVGQFTRTDPASVDGLPPGAVYPAGVEPPLGPHELPGAVRGPGMTSEQVWQYIEGLPCSK